MAKEGTLNEGQGTEDVTPSVSSAEGDGFVSTIELAEQARAAAAAEPEKTDKAEGDDKGKKAGEKPPEKIEGKEGDDKKKGEEAKGKDKTGAKAKDTPEEGKDKPKDKGKEAVPYDRFQQVVKERNTDRQEVAKTREELAEVRGQLKALTEQIGKKEKPAPSHTNVLSKSDAEIREVFEEGGDIKGFLGDLTRQIRAELIEDLEGKFVSEGKIKEIAKGTLDEGRTAEQEQALNKTIEAAYQKFSEENEGFDDMWGSGELEAYCEKHPEHTPISAFMVLGQGKDGKTFDERVEEQVEAMRDEIEKEVREELKTKKSARTIGPGPAAAPSGDGKDPRLTNPKAYGGDIAALTQLSDEREAQAGG